MRSDGKSLKKVDELIRSYLGLKHSLVGVKILKSEAGQGNPLKPEKPMEFCKMLRLAATENRMFRYGRGDESCMSAHFILGFREPKFGDINPRIKPSETRSVTVAPLSRMEEEPDVVHTILNPKQMMDLTALLGAAGVEHVSAEFKGEKACSDFMAKPFMDSKPNLSFLCGGARLFAEFRENELIFAAPPKVYEQVAGVVESLIKSGGALCGCRTSDLPPEMVEEFKRMGLAKGVDYFFGKLDGQNVRVYLNKDVKGQFKFLTIHLPLKTASEEKAKALAASFQKGGVMTYSVTPRGYWLDVSQTVRADDIAVDLQSGENVEKAVRHLLKEMLRQLKDAGYEA